MLTKRIRILVFFCISVMAESEIKSREAKVDFDEGVLAGKKAKAPNNLTRNEIIDISFS